MEKKVSLVIPRLRPTNGRIILQLERREEQKLDSGIILPPSIVNKKSTDNRATENPDDYNYFVVAISPEVHTQMMIYKRNFVPEFVSEPERTSLAHELDKLQIGNKVFLSSLFETIKYAEDTRIYGIIHWQDILGIESTEKMTQENTNAVGEPEQLTIDIFNTLPDQEPFMSGTFIDNETGVNVTGSNKQLSWVAIKKTSTTWHIKYSEEKDLMGIIKEGTILTSAFYASKLIDCSKKVLDLYKV